MDNGPEFAGRVLDAWAYRRGITLALIQPGKPTQNAFVESFNSRPRDECLNAPGFVTRPRRSLTIEAKRDDTTPSIRTAHSAAARHRNFTATWK